MMNSKKKFEKNFQFFFVWVHFVKNVENRYMYLTTKRNIINIKSRILNLTRRLQLEDIFHEKEFNNQPLYI